MFDAPEIGRDDVKDIFNEFMNVLQINKINTSSSAKFAIVHSNLWRGKFV